MAVSDTVRDALGSVVENAGGGKSSKAGGVRCRGPRGRGGRRARRGRAAREEGRQRDARAGGAEAREGGRERRDGGGKGGMPGVGKGRRMPVQQHVDVAVPLETA
jgi:hypothetical protein